MTLRTLRTFMQNIPNEAEVIFSEGIITFIFNGDTVALNKFGATWENGVGYLNNGTVCCGECSHFDCARCGAQLDETDS